MSTCISSRWIHKVVTYVLIVALLTLILSVAPAVERPRGAEVSPSGNLLLRTPHFTIEYRDPVARSGLTAVAWGKELAYRYFVVQHKFRDGKRTWKWFGSSPPWPATCEKITGTHEFFHSIQLLGYNLPTHDKFLIEGSAVWAEYEIFPEHHYREKCKNPGTLHLLLGGTDLDFKKYTFTAYGGWLFWRYVADRYGSAELIRRLLEAIKTEGWPAWRRELGKLVNKPFLELWTEFAVALATRDLRDAPWLYARAEERTPHVPVPAFVGEWTGQALSIEQSNFENPYPQICSRRSISGKTEWELQWTIETCPAPKEIINAGEPLVVRHPYGIHFLRVTPKSEKSLALRFEGDPDTEFRVHIVAQKPSGSYEIFRLQEECALSEPSSYTLLQIVITRGEKGAGEYRMSLQPPSDADAPPCQPVKVF